MTNNLRFFSILKLFVAASSTLVASSTLAQILDYETVTDELLQNPPSGDGLRSAGFAVAGLRCARRWFFQEK